MNGKSSPCPKTLMAVCFFFSFFFFSHYWRGQFYVVQQQRVPAFSHVFFFFLGPFLSFRILTSSSVCLAQVTVQLSSGLFPQQEYINYLLDRQPNILFTYYILPLITHNINRQIHSRMSSLQGNDRFRIEAEKGERTNPSLYCARGNKHAAGILLALFRTVGEVRQKGLGRPFFLYTWIRQGKQYLPSVVDNIHT
jgi:hypothetical protein